VIFGDDESYELGFAQNVTNGASSLTPYSIAVPSDAVLGTTRMRVSIQYLNYPTPCDNGFDGEVEDYEIVVESLAMGINELTISKDLILYPNPTSGLLTISGSDIEADQLKLFNALGQELSTQIKIIEKNKNYVIIDISGLSTGMYYLKSGSSTKKVYKH